MSNPLPAKFNDTEGREWRLAFTIGAARRLRDDVGFDIGDLRDGRAFAMLAFDPAKFGQVMWVLCERQADSKGVDEIAFAEGFGGETIDYAMKALEEAVVNFTPANLRSAVQKTIQMSVGAIEEASNAVIDVATQNHGQVSQMIQQEATKQVNQILSGTPSTN